jgi:hypothetical protein
MVTNELSDVNISKIFIRIINRDIETKEIKTTYIIKR